MRIGVFDRAAQGYRLRKPYLSVSLGPTAPAISYETERWLACHLLSAAESNGVRKLSVWSANRHGPGRAVCTMQIWLFATDITISSSETKASEPVSVVKVLYHRPKQVPEHPADDSRLSGGRLNAAALAEGEVELERQEWSDLRRILESSATLLPPKARSFQEWNVGLLRRFTATDNHLAP